MGKQVIKLTESQIREMVAESVANILKENEMDEFNIFKKGDRERLKSAWQGAKQGYNYQKAMDRGTEGFKTEHDYEDMKKDSNPFGPRSENTAQEQTNQLLDQARQYQAMANKLKAQANALTKQYGLVKTGVNQRVNGTQPSVAPHTRTIATNRGNNNGYGKGRNPNNINPVKQTGLWGGQ